MKLITPELEARFKEVGDQSENENPLVIAKFFDSAGSGRWYATGYDKETNIAYGYVTGLAYDEWGYFSIEEMESAQIFPTITMNGEKYTPKRELGIERDIYFPETNYYDLFPEKKRIDQLNKNKKEQSQELDY